jgi:hypothetical protein
MEQKTAVLRPVVARPPTRETLRRAAWLAADLLAFALCTDLLSRTL